MKVQDWMPFQISYGIHCLTITHVVDYYLKSSKISTKCYQCEVNSTQEHMEHKYKTFKAIHTFIIHELDNPPDGFCTHIFSALEITLIFIGLFLYRLPGARQRSIFI